MAVFLMRDQAKTLSIGLGSIQGREPTRAALGGASERSRSAMDANMAPRIAERKSCGRLDGRGPGELCDRLLRDCDSHHFALWRGEAPYRLNVGASIMFGSRHERRSEAGEIITICLTTMGVLGSKFYRVVTFLEVLKL